MGKPPITYTINGMRIEFDGEYYNELKAEDRFDQRLEEALKEAQKYNHPYVIVRSG